ncbi:MAG: CBS domain-containing protein [Candidatus Aenigmatarchaeota archaeon]|nr:CBS domain-containing protein [Candidatus Aenigmarchaeota archaeon]
MLVNEIMNRNVVVVKKDATIKEASEVMSKLDISSLVVVEGDKIVGILTNTDIVRSVAQNKQPESTLVEEMMTSKVITIEPDKKIEDAVDLMLENKIRELPVVENNKIKGIITVTDIAVAEPKLIASIASLLALQLPGYPGG